jgi:hypothetical protein
MAMLGIGVKVNTLPVVPLGVGVGVDYGIYLFERMKHGMEDNGLKLSDAFVEALKQRGTASVFTAVTMTVSVATWTFSALKFQADMGILLAFMFLVGRSAQSCCRRSRLSRRNRRKVVKTVSGGAGVTRRRVAFCRARRRVGSIDELALAAAHELAAGRTGRLRVPLARPGRPSTGRSSRNAAGRQDRRAR